MHELGRPRLCPLRSFLRAPSADLCSVLFIYKDNWSKLSARCEAAHCLGWGGGIWITAVSLLEGKELAGEIVHFVDPNPSLATEPNELPVSKVKP